MGEKKQEKKSEKQQNKTDNLKEKIKELEQQLKEKEELIKKQEQEINELKDKYLRLVAETDNMKKRLEREKKDFLEYANENLLKDLLPVIDNIERAIEHADEDANVKDFIKGVQMTLDNFLKVLEKYNVKSIKALNKEFDPNFHEAMAIKETDSQPPNTVVEELQKGYMYKERLLRPSLVTVAKEPKNNIDNKD